MLGVDFKFQWAKAFKTGKEQCIRNVKFELNI
jgi:hypothetical protein